MSQTATQTPVAAPTSVPGNVPNQPSTPAVAPETYELTIDGKPVKMSLDEMKKAAALGGAAHKKFEEAAQMRKQAEGLLSRLRDPKQAIALLNDPRLGLNQDQVTEAFEDWYHSSKIKPSQMTPEQKELADAKAKLAKFEEQEADAKKKQEDEENERADQEAMKQLQTEIMGLLDKSGLPKSKFTASRLSYWIRVNEVKGINAPAELIIEQVKQETREIMNQMVSASDGDVLANLLGEDTMKKVQKYNLEKIRAKRASLQSKPKEETSFTPKEQPKEKLTVKEVKQRLRDFK